MQTVTSNDIQSVAQFITHVTLPKAESHKGQNGRVLIVGGSPLFHAASLWSAEVISHFADMVHYASTSDNNEILQSLKKTFRNGIAVKREQLSEYLLEDDVTLIGPGLERTEETRKLTLNIIRTIGEKQLVLDAGSLQMMKPDWLRELSQKAVITPHQKEFEALFSVSVANMSESETMQIVQQKAAECNCVILMKAITDYVSDGERSVVIHGGNQGLTKGGTGDILAGLVSGLLTVTDRFTACVLASFILKRSADRLFSTHGYWYNNSHILTTIPKVVHELLI